MLALGAAAALLAPAGGFAATSTTEYNPFAVESPFVGAGARFPERLAQVGDVTGDGVPDVFASSYVVPVDGKAGAGSVYLFSGADRSLVYTITEPDPQVGSNFGFYINVPGDLTGDGKDDVLVGSQGRSVFVGKDDQGAANTKLCGTPEPNGCNEGQGRAHAFSGPTGTRLFTLDNPNPQADGRFGSRLAGAGDVTGDGVPDIIAGASSNDVPAGCALKTPVAADCRKNEGEAFIFNGRTGSLVRQLNVPTADRAPAPCTANCGNMGGTVQSPGDIDRDGVADQISAAYSLRPDPTRDGRIYLFSGKTGGVLARIDQPDPDTRAFWGLQDIENNSPGDVTGDGVPDIYGNGFLQDGPNGEASAGRSWIFNGATTVASGKGVVARELKDPNPTASKAWGFTVRTTDYNKDGFPDLLVGSLSGNNTQVPIIDGRDDVTVLKTLLMPAGDIQPVVTGNRGPTFTQGLAAPGDLNRDGEPDYAVTAHGLDVGANIDQGRLYFYVSSVPRPTPTPTPTPTYTIPTPTPTPTPTVSPGPTPTATPTPRKRPGLTATVRPKRDRKKPFRFTTRGSVKRPAGVSKSAGCKGKVRITVKRKGAHKTLSSRLATVKSTCKFTRKVTFKNSKRFGKGRKARRRGTLRFTIRFQGNSRLKSRRITRTARYG